MGRNRIENQNSKSQWHKIIIAVILGLLIGSIMTIVIAYNAIIGNMKYEEIDKSDLEINENLFEDVSKTTDIKEEEFNKIITFAFFGSDSRDINNEYSGRSDSIMIASVNPIKKSIVTYSDISSPKFEFIVFKLNCSLP